jgi:ABC-type multidrug transport system ATPase subunit
MTIIATIHSPSNDLFNLFDRLILLNDGWQIYQGPVTTLPDYMRSMNLQLKTFQSLSDTIMKLSIAPAMMKDGLTHQDLKNYYIQHYQPQVESDMEGVLGKYKNF